MAIIDILTHYDAKKKAAHAAKTVKHGVSAKTYRNPSDCGDGRKIKGTALPSTETIHFLLCEGTFYPSRSRSCFGLSAQFKKYQQQRCSGTTLRGASGVPC